jgi:hypothetical protein
MGITEYVRPTHTFSILICSFDAETAPVARRIHYALRHSSGLYTSIGGADSLYNVVARHYEKLLHVTLTETSDPAAVIAGWNATLVVPIQRALGVPEIVVPRKSDGDPDAQILLSMSSRNKVADTVAGVLRTAL